MLIDFWAAEKFGQRGNIYKEDNETRIATNDHENIFDQEFEAKL